MRARLKLIAAWLTALVAVAVVAVSAGLVPIAASSGHWRVTNTVLDFAKRRSVALRSWPLTAPDLSRPGLIALGAAHYENGCRPCHGRPGMPMPLVPHRMTPHPPDLQRQAARWTAEELFYLVKHGVKFTGMPAWPYADRDDEVWPVVAFVQRLPTLDGAGYERLTAMAPAQSAPERTVTTSSADQPVDTTGAALADRLCARCHGQRGQGGRAGVLVPRLSTQRGAYLRSALAAYAAGERRSGIMGPIAAMLRPTDIDSLAAFYASQPTDDDLHSDASMPAYPSIASGARVAMMGVPDRDVPACLSCHPTDAAIAVNDAYPRLAGLSADYLEQQLTLFAAGRRGGGPSAHLMRPVALGLTPERRRHVAEYFASQPLPATPSGTRRH